MNGRTVGREGSRGTGARQGPLALSSYCSLPSPSGLLIDRIFEEQVSLKMSSAHNLIL